MPRHPARIYTGTERNIAFLAGRLRAGELVAVPTETVYGLAANALDARACAKIFRAKGRPTQDPLIVHIHSRDQLEELCEVNDAARRLTDALWPGGLTIVLPKKPLVPNIVTAGRNSVAVRMPSLPLFRRLLKRAGVPVAAPSANRFGYVSPTTAEHVRQGLGSKIHHILEGGPSPIGVESTIVDLRDPRRPTVLRFGAVGVEAIEKALGTRVVVHERRASSAKVSQIAPGMLARHYSPRTPVVLHERLDPQAVRLTADADDAFVFFRKPAGRCPRNFFWLDARGRLAGAARTLFALLRRLDARGFRRLHVELAPEEGLGRAINDRLRRAAAR